MEAQLWLLALILALAPGVALMWYIRYLDRYEPEPWGNIALAFFAGSFSVIPALLIGEPLNMIKFNGFLGTVWTAFVVAALNEEFCKGFMARAAIWEKKEFNEVMDGVVYFGVAHMGFAITENLLYVFANSGGNVAQALMTAFVRTTTAVPLHVVVGMIMGYHMGVAKFETRPAERLKHYAEALLIPVLLHGFYDVAAFNQQGMVQISGPADLIRVGFGSASLYAAVVALWLFLLPRIRKAKESSPFRPKESLEVSPTVCYNCGSYYPLEAHYCHICAAPVVRHQTQAYYYGQSPGAR